jgi:hypothetical protein
VRWLALLALASCDRVLKLDDIKAPPDAPTCVPSGCPSDGSAPTICGTPSKIASGCTTYTVGGPAWSTYGDGNLATAQCSSAFMAGLAGGPLTHREVGLSGGNPHQFGVDQMFMVSVDVVTSYKRTTTPDLWSNPVAESFMGLNAGDAIGTPSMTSTSGERRDIVVSGTGAMVEYAELMAHVWTATMSSTLNVTVTGPANLSSDGLRLVFAAYNGTDVGVYYLARLTTEQPFEALPAILFKGPSKVLTPFMTDDCRALYFSDGNNDVYAVGP